MAGKFLKRPASNLFFPADTLSKRHTSTSGTMHVKDDNEKRHYDIEWVPCCRGDLRADARNGLLLRQALTQPAAGSSFPAEDPRPPLFRTAPPHNPLSHPRLLLH